LVIKTNFGTKQASEFNLGLVRFATPDEAILGINTNKAVNPKGLNEAINSINGLIYDIVLLADNWEGATAPYTYTINSITGITSNTNAHTMLNSNVTEAQLLSFREAMIVDGGLSTDTIVFKALGIKPAINIPIKLIVSKSLYIEDDYEPQYEVDTLPRATVDIYGTVRIATPFDVEDATSNIRVITPLLLAKNMPNGVAGLDASSLINDSYISNNIARVNSPALTGTPTAPTPEYTDDSDRIATTAYVKDVFENSPVLDGIPTAPTADPDTNTNQIATTAYADAKVADEINTDVTTIAPSQNAVFDALTLKADLDSPTLTGTPTAPTASTGTNTTQIATTEFVKSEIDSVLAVADVLTYKGTIGVGGTVTSLPTSDYKIGWAYKVITAGTYSGYTCEIGDMITCVVDFNITPNNSDWTVIQSNLDGAVIGPTSAINNHIATFNGTTGKLIKDSGYTIETSVPAGALFTDTVYTHPTSGVGAGTYTSVTVDVNGHVIEGTNPTTLSGYGITDAASLDSPALTGIPTAPTALYTDDSTQIATTAYVKDVFENSPVLDGIPTAPTAVVGTNSNQIATTEFVNNQLTTNENIYTMTEGQTIVDISDIWTDTSYKLTCFINRLYSIENTHYTKNTVDKTIILSTPATDGDTIIVIVRPI